METQSLKTLQLISVRWWNASAYYAISLTEALNRAGVFSIAGGRHSSPPLQKAREFHLPTFTEINLETFNPLTTILNVIRLKRYIRQNRITLVNGHRPEDGLYAALVSRRFPYRLPVVRTVSDVRPPKDHALNKWLHQQGMDFLIFSCNASYERYQSVWHIFENKSAVIYSSIDTDVFQPRPRNSGLRRTLGIGEDEVLIGIIARLSPVKDHHTFLRAAALVHRQAPNARFLISGENAQLTREDLERFAADLGISERVVFLPRDDSISVRDLIAALDIGVVASNGSEVICRVAVEYMAMGKPQVVTDINVLPEIVDDGENGFVVPAGDAGAMAKALFQLIQHPELRIRMGEIARRYSVERFSYPVFAEKTLGVYQRLVKNAL